MMIPKSVLSLQTVLSVWRDKSGAGKQVKLLELCGGSQTLFSDDGFGYDKKPITAIQFQVLQSLLSRFS